MRQDLGYSHNWDYDPFTFVVYYNGRTRWAPNNSTKKLVNMADARYLNYTFDVMLNNKNAGPGNYGLATAARLCPPRGCPVPPPPNPAIPLRWSKKSSWSSNGYKVPVEGQSVTITSDMWIVLDISPPKLATLTIEGKLSFLSNNSHPLTLTLTVQSIALWGIMEIIGQDNNSFAGSANVIIYGGIGASHPLKMGEGNFVGAKVISVAGQLIARGRQSSHTWIKLNNTAFAGASIITLSGQVSWSAGDEIVFSPTGYFDSNGVTWNVANTVESTFISQIITIVTSNGNYSQLTLHDSLNHTHLCEQVHGELFCGAVGLLTRSVKFTSLDCQDKKTTSYGFCANIQVIDDVDSYPYRYGSVDLRDVELVNFGKINSDHYAVAIAHRDYNHPPSYVMGCSFKYSINFATRIANCNNFTFSNNVVVGSYGGGVYVDAATIHFVVSNNLVLASFQRIFKSLKSVVTALPIAAFTVFSSDGDCFGNLAAGSNDQGFAVVTTMFHSSSVSSSQCAVTRTNPFAYSLSALTENRRFFETCY